MTPVEWIVGNSLAAGALALVALGAGRLGVRPALRHLLWLLVLVRLVMPPVWIVGWLPDWSGGVATSGGPVVDASIVPTTTVEPSTVTGTVTAPNVEPEPGKSSIVTISRVALVAWLAGGGGLLGLAWWRSRRFGRWLVVAGRVDEDLAERVASLSERIGLTRPPRALCVSASVGPLVTLHRGRATLVLPEVLLESLPSAQLDAVLAHELAHLVRRDHWLRRLELV
ncbi:MAG: M56 family metallopeptidase, partial [Acidobacteriota bacterium]